jgi:hypothetical protein
LRRADRYLAQAAFEGQCRRLAPARGQGQRLLPLDLGVERLQDDVLNRAINGTPKPVFRREQKVGSIQQLDNRPLQFLLKVHRPDLYGDRGHAAATAAIASRP